MEKENEKYLSLKEILIQHGAELKVIQDMMRKGEKKFEDCNENINEILRSKIKDKDNIKEWSEERFVTKKCFEPIKKTYNSLAAAGIGVLVLIGSVGLGVFIFLKNHLIK